jgi:hypothetical protein
MDVLSFDFVLKIFPYEFERRREDNLKNGYVHIRLFHLRLI